MCVIRRHFLACEDIAGGSGLSAAVTFFHEIQRPFRWVPDVRWTNHYFAHNKEAFPCVRPCTQLWPLHVQSTSDASRSLTTLTRPGREHQGGGRRRGLGRERHGGREDSVVVSHAEGSTTVRGFTGSYAVAGEQQVWVSRGIARPAMGVRWGGEACAAAQPAAGRREQAVPPTLV